MWSPRDTALLLFSVGTCGAAAAQQYTSPEVGLYYPMRGDSVLPDGATLSDELRFGLGIVRMIADPGYGDWPWAQAMQDMCTTAGQVCVCARARAWAPCSSSGRSLRRTACHRRGPRTRSRARSSRTPPGACRAARAGGGVSATITLEASLKTTLEALLRATTPVTPPVVRCRVGAVSCLVVGRKREGARDRVVWEFSARKVGPKVYTDVIAHA